MSIRGRLGFFVVLGISGVSGMMIISVFGLSGVSGRVINILFLGCANSLWGVFLMKRSNFAFVFFRGFITIELVLYIFLSILSNP